MSAPFSARAGKPAKRMQYEGTVYQSDRGTTFFGTAEQNNRLHYMAQFSGLWSQNAWDVNWEMVRDGLVKATRIDIAVTVELGDAAWSQSALFSRLRRFSSTRSISYLESKSGPDGRKLATVYVGQRSSDRMIRIYEKVLDDEKIALRFEAEYKSARAGSVAGLLLAGIRSGSFLRHELDVLNDRPLLALFNGCLLNEPTAATVRKEESRTERWLIDQVLPTLQRFLNEHGNEAHELVYVFLKVLLNSGVDVTKMKE